jgi:hypothetical protein
VSFWRPWDEEGRRASRWLQSWASAGHTLCWCFAAHMTMAAERGRRFLGQMRTLD